MGCHIDIAEAPHGQSEPRRRQVFLPLSGAAGGATAATDGEGATGGHFCMDRRTFLRIYGYVWIFMGKNDGFHRI